MLSIYIFFQQLGSIIGLICGGYISDGIGWRWSMPIVSIACVSALAPNFSAAISQLNLYRLF